MRINQVWTGLSNIEPLDVVYSVGEISEELRYSLRSLKNLPHNKVFIFGNIPEWAKNTVNIPLEQGKNKWEQVSNNLLKVIENPTVSEDFIWFNDDFFVLQSIQGLPYYENGTLEKLRKGNNPKEYKDRIKVAEDKLKQFGKKTYNFELHIPIVFNKEKLKAIYQKYPNIGGKRSLYCNEYGIRGIQRGDVKIYNIFDEINPRIDFLSTTDYSFNGKVGRMIKERFKEKSIYEN